MHWMTEETGKALHILLATPFRIPSKLTCVPMTWRRLHGRSTSWNAIHLKKQGFNR